MEQRILLKGNLSTVGRKVSEVGEGSRWHLSVVGPIGIEGPVAILSLQNSIWILFIIVLDTSSKRVLVFEVEFLFLAAVLEGKLLDVLGIFLVFNEDLFSFAFYLEFRVRR